MAKLDLKALDELIKEVLDVNYTSTPDAKTPTGKLKVKYARGDIGDDTRRSNQAYTDLFNAGGDPLVLDASDVEKIITYSSGNKAYALLKWLGNPNNNSRIQGDVAQALVNARLGNEDPLVRQQIDSYLSSINVDSSGNKKIGIEDRPDLKPLGKVSTPVSQISGELTPVATLSQLKRKIDSAYIEVFDAIAGNTLLEKLSSLEEFAKDIDDGVIDGYKDFNLFKAANLGLVLNEFGAMAKEYDATSAGTQFEKILALLTSGVVIGGESGAVDVESVVGSGERILYSAKLYQNANFHQALAKGTDTGIDGVVKRGKEPLYYIFGFKTQQDLSLRKDRGLGGGESQKYRYIYVYILKITWDDSEDTYMCQAINSGGREFGPPAKLTTSETQLNFSPYFTDKDTFQYYAYEIPVISQALANDLSVSVGQYLSNIMLKKVADPNDANKQVYRDPLIANIVNIFKRLQNMERNTQEYNALKAKEDKPLNTHLEYVKQISLDYKNLKTEYEDVFTIGQGKATTISESKFAELDKLILEVLKNNS